MHSQRVRAFELQIFKIRSFFLFVSFLCDDVCHAVHFIYVDEPVVHDIGLEAVSIPAACEPQVD